MKYLDSLNPQQKEAVLCTEGPLLILAGAGSGKTYTMASRIAYLLQAKRVKPYEIVGLSFTRRAAHELKERVQKMVASAGYRESLKGLNISTFHGLCVKILRKFHREFELSPHFTICSQSDQESLFEEIYKELN